MKKSLLLATIAILSFSVFSQEIFIKQSVVINIEVPIRVFKSSTFVDNLTIDDFEVFEDGIPQKIEAVYLVKKRAIERSEEKKRFFPETTRNFFLNFEVSEYTAKLGEAVDYFVQNVIMPDDNLYIISPMKTYRLKDEALGVTSREEIVNELKGLLRKDAKTGNSEYSSTINDLTVISRSISAAFASGQLDAAMRVATPPEELDSFSSDLFSGMEFDEQLIHYEGLLHRLELLRRIDEMKLLDFAKFLKNKEGQKYVFLFYQREFLPQIEPKLLTEYINLYQERPDILSTISGIFNFQRRNVSFNVKRVKQAYADSSISVHFLFIASPRKIIPGVHMKKSSKDIYNPFKEITKATKGFTENSSNPVFLFQKALEASENYYLLYYSPKKYVFDGKFKEIKVQVKNKNYKVTHRSGYFAD